MKKPWKKLASEYVLDNPWYKVRKDKVKLPNGKIIEDFYIGELPKVAIVFPLTSNNEVVLVKQYRYGANLELLELPAGIFNPNNEKAVDTAKRELEEETGFITNDKLVYLGRIYDYASKETHYIEMFLAKNVEEKGEINREDTEDIEASKIPVSSLPNLIKNGKIISSHTISTIYKALKYLNLPT